MPRRVLWVIKGLGPGGAERLLCAQARAHHHDRFHIECAYVLPWKDHLAEELEQAGVRTHCLSRRRTDVRWPLHLAKMVRSGEWDVIHVHSPLPGAVARLSARTMPKARRPEADLDRAQPLGDTPVADPSGEPVVESLGRCHLRRHRRGTRLALGRSRETCDHPATRHRCRVGRQSAGRSGRGSRRARHRPRRDRRRHGRQLPSPEGLSQPARQRRSCSPTEASPFGSSPSARGRRNPRSQPCTSNSGSATG